MKTRQCYSISGRYCFLPKALGEKSALSLLGRSPGREVNTLSIVGPLYGDTGLTGKVCETHFVLLFLHHRGSSEEPGAAGPPCLIILAAERVSAGQCRDGAAAWGFLHHMVQKL